MLPVTKLQSGMTLLVDGPASIRLIEGEAGCFGGRLVQDRLILVNSERRLPVETSSTASLEVKLGTGAVVKEILGSSIPGSWIEAGQVVHQARGTVAVIGEVDSGKSSLTTYLANVSRSTGLSVNVIDADIGQADVGPPTTISGAVIHDAVQGLQDLQPSSAFFVGDTSPSLVPDKVIAGTNATRIHLPSSEVLFVNTDGWIEGTDGLNYKMKLLDDLRPDMVIGLADEGGRVDRVLDSRRGSTVLKLERSGFARSRTRDERRRAREAGYRRFLEGSRKVGLLLKEVVVRSFDSTRPVDLRQIHPIRGTLAGLTDDEGMLFGISRLSSVSSTRVSLETRRWDVNPATLELGTVRLSRDYEETGFLHVGFGH